MLGLTLNNLLNGMLLGIICKALRFIQNLFLKVFSSLEILISAVLGILGAIIDIAKYIQ